MEHSSGENQPASQRVCCKLYRSQAHVCRSVWSHDGVAAVIQSRLSWGNRNRLDVAVALCTCSLGSIRVDIVIAISELALSDISTEIAALCAAINWTVTAISLYAADKQATTRRAMIRKQFSCGERLIAPEGRTRRGATLDDGNRRGSSYRRTRRPPPP